jgi:hypothetical protein
VGFGIGFTVVAILSLNPDVYYFHYLIELGILGLFASLGQWLVLQSRLQKVWLWLPVTTLGLPLGFFLSDIVSIIFPIDFLAYPIVAGLLIGSLQWRVIHKSMTKSSRWILVSVLSWGIAFSVGQYISSSLESFALGIVTGLIIGAISGGFVESRLINVEDKAN